MRKIKPEKFTVYIFLIVIMLFFCMTLLQTARKTTIEILNMNFFHAPAVKNIDWEVLYPFSPPKSEDKQERSRLMKAFLYTKGRIEEYSSGFFRVRMKLVEFARKYEDLIGWNMAYVNGYNPVIKLHDGYLTGITPSRDITLNAQAVIDFNEYCRNNGIEFFYVNAPAKLCRYDDNDISGTLDFLNQNADKFLELLGKSGVKYYDLREILHEEGMNHHEAFFVTDHHWKPETGLWAARHILEFLRDDYGYDTDLELLNPDKFKRVVYPEWFLGSQGKKVTLSQTKPEDIELFYPKYKTSIHFELPKRNIDISGDFSVFYNMQSINQKDLYIQNPYAAYKYGDQSLTHIKNLSNMNGKKILFIHDSFSDCLIPFLSLGIESIDEFDLRHFNGSLKTYMKSHNFDFDAVIIAYNSSIVSDKPAKKDSAGITYDFR